MLSQDEAKLIQAILGASGGSNPAEGHNNLIFLVNALNRFVDELDLQIEAEYQKTLTDEMFKQYKGKEVIDDAIKLEIKKLLTKYELNLGMIEKKIAEGKTQLETIIKEALKLSGELKPKANKSYVKEFGQVLNLLVTF
jgi:hypothetical protein